MALMTRCNVKGVTHSEKLAGNHQLTANCSQPYNLCLQLICVLSSATVLFCFTLTTRMLPFLAAGGNCSQLKSSKNLLYTICSADATSC